MSFMDTYNAAADPSGSQRDAIVRAILLMNQGVPMEMAFGMAQQQDSEPPRPDEAPPSDPASENAAGVPGSIAANFGFAPDMSTSIHAGFVGDPDAAGTVAAPNSQAAPGFGMVSPDTANSQQNAGFTGFGNMVGSPTSPAAPGTPAGYLGYGINQEGAPTPSSLSPADVVSQNSPQAAPAAPVGWSVNGPSQQQQGDMVSNAISNAAQMGWGAIMGGFNQGINQGWGALQSAFNNPGNPAPSPSQQAAPSQQATPSSFNENAANNAVAAALASAIDAATGGYTGNSTDATAGPGTGYGGAVTADVGYGGDIAGGPGTGFGTGTGPDAGLGGLEGGSGLGGIGDGVGGDGAGGDAGK